MNCPVCLENGVEFPVEVVSWSSTIIGPEHFVDEKGLSHLHDPTVSVTVYRCPVDHETTVKERPRPCWCGWKAA